MLLVTEIQLESCVRDQENSQKTDKRNLKNRTAYWTMLSEAVSLSLHQTTKFWTWQIEAFTDNKLNVAEMRFLSKIE